MVKIKVNNHEFYIDGYLKENLDILKEMVARNWDGIGYICGFEGDGKTTLASQICYYLDSTFTLNRVIFTPEQFLQCCLSAKKEEVILFDESYFTFNNRQIYNQITNTIISLLTTIRKKRLYIIIVAPTIFDINKYIILDRTRFLIRVYASGIERGYFEFFNRDQKYDLYNKGKRTHNIKAVPPNFRGRFTSFFPFDMDEYEEKKDTAMQYFQKNIRKKPDLDDLVVKRLRIEAQTEIINWLRINQWLKHGAIRALAGYYKLSIDRVKDRLYDMPKEKYISQEANDIPINNT